MPAIAAPVVSSLTDTLLGETIEGGGERRGTGFTEAVGSTAANIINRSLNGIVSQTIVNQFTGGKLNYASIVTDAFGNAIGSSIAGEIRASLVANQQEGQLAAAEQEVSALQRQQAMAAYGGNYGSNTSNGEAFQASIAAQDQEMQALFGVRNGVGMGAGSGGSSYGGSSDGGNHSFFDNTADPYLSYLVKPEDNVNINLNRQASLQNPDEVRESLQQSANQNGLGKVSWRILDDPPQPALHPRGCLPDLRGQLH